MSELLQVVVTGLGSGSIYAIIALGFSIVYKSTRVVNFAHGEYLVVCGIGASVLTTAYGWPLLVAGLAMIVVGILLGLGTEAVAFRALGRPDHLTMTIGTVAIGVVLQAVVLRATGGATYRLENWPGPSFAFGGVTISSQVVWNLLLVVVLTVGLQLFFNRSRRGVALQAAADDRETASLFGVSPQSATAWSFGIAGALGAIGGLALTPLSLMSFHLGMLFGLKGFAAAMLGGLGSMQGALVGGLLIGLAEATVATYAGGTLAAVTAFGVLLLVLLLKPSGIFRVVAVERV